MWVCGKTSLETVEVIKENKLDISYPKIKKKIILKSPELLTRNNLNFLKQVVSMQVL
ncbi:MAG: hypothetical protein CM1200mP5_1150 [Candidatus Pelagibacterales bacterium]|nr:MAG: hypothetical protein CM1200mP5_1150 [Pelagibacterales bacterium]